MKNDIRDKIDTWYLVIEDQGYKIGDWDETRLELERRVRDNPGKQIIMLSSKEYHTRYTKRGKKSRR